MIATIAGTAVARVITIITRLQRSTNSKTATRKAKRGTWRLPLSLFSVSSRKRA